MKARKPIRTTPSRSHSRRRRRKSSKRRSRRCLGKSTRASEEEQRCFRSQGQQRRFVRLSPNSDEKGVRTIRQMRSASRRPVAQGSGRALRALARRAGGRLGIGVLGGSKTKRNSTMERTLALHFYSLGKGETPSFRIPPVTERGRAGILERGRLLDLVASPRLGCVTVS